MKVLIDMAEIPKNDYQRRVLFHEGIVLDELTNGEVLMKIYNVDANDVKIGVYYVNVFFDERNIVTFNLEWWNQKWGE